MVPTDRPLSDLLRKAPGYAVTSLRRWTIRRYRSLYFRVNADHPALRYDRAVERLREADAVLFLCWGNVCRSPLAERYLDRRLAERGVDGVAVRSAGLGQTAGRSSPDAAIAAAAEHGVDLADHVSRRVTPEQVAESDVVFVMDYNNFHSVVTRFPRLGQSVSLLGVAGEAPGVVVPDPYGGDADRFERTYRTITRAIDDLFVAADLGRREAVDAGGA
jgi:protein-tyrosine phosphatase